MAADERFHAGAGVLSAGLTPSECNKTGILYRAPRDDLTGVSLADVFGTPISTKAGGVVAPREYHRASRWYLAGLMYDLCYTLGR
jgi:hypothetical protein